jgi:hypothetical protein
MGPAQSARTALEARTVLQPATVHVERHPLRRHQLFLTRRMKSGNKNEGAFADAQTAIDSSKDSG